MLSYLLPPGRSRGLFSFMFSYQNFAYVSLLSHTCYMAALLILDLFMLMIFLKRLVVKFSLLSYYFLPVTLNFPCILDRSQTRVFGLLIKKNRRGIAFFFPLSEFGPVNRAASIYLLPPPVL